MGYDALQPDTAGIDDSFSALGLFALDLAGFVANEPQSQPAITTIRVLTALIPGVFVVLGAWVARGYPLTRARHAEILAELERRRGSAEGGP